MNDRRAIRDAIVAKYGVPKNRDEVRFERTKQIAETLAARYPSEGWGLKIKPSTGVVATDILATRSPFELVDIWAGDGNPDSDARAIWDLKPVDPNDAAFVSVEPHDWLAGSQPPVEEPGEPPEPCDLGPVLKTVEALTKRVESLEQSREAILGRIDALEKKPAPAANWNAVTVSTGRSWGHAHSVTVQQP